MKDKWHNQTNVFLSVVRYSVSKNTYHFEMVLITANDSYDYILEHSRFWIPYLARLFSYSPLKVAAIGGLKNIFVKNSPIAINLKI